MDQLRATLQFEWAPLVRPVVGYVVQAKQTSVRVLARLVVWPPLLLRPWLRPWLWLWLLLLLLLLLVVVVLPHLW